MLIYARIFITLGLSGLAFAIAGVSINLISPIPRLTILIDRSYCPQNQWSQVAQNYTDIYRQHQRRQVDLQAVVLFSNLGEEVFSTPPRPPLFAPYQPMVRLTVSGKRSCRKDIPKRKFSAVIPRFNSLV